jgi:hypothetical protein
MQPRPVSPNQVIDRRHFIGGSDARIIMGQDEKALIRLWQEKRDEVGPEDLSGNLIVQLGLATEDLNRTSKSVAPSASFAGIPKGPSRLRRCGNLPAEPLGVAAPIVPSRSPSRTCGGLVSRQSSNLTRRRVRRSALRRPW